jgi:hypothetical protein
MGAAPKPIPPIAEMPVKEMPPDVRTQLETVLKARPEFLKNLLLPDLSVVVVMAEGTVQMTHCHRVTFDVTLSPGLLASKSGVQPVRARVIDVSLNRICFDGTVMVPASGGSSRVSVEFPMPEDATWTPDFTNEFTIEVDPDHTMLERAESNNKITVFGTCVG